MENHQSSVKTKTMTSIDLSTVTTDVISPTYDTSIITTINIGVPQQHSTFNVCPLSYSVHGMTYYVDSENNAGQPREILAYASHLIPSTVNNFYWKLDILPLGKIIQLVGMKMEPLSAQQ